MDNKLTIDKIVLQKINSSDEDPPIMIKLKVEFADFDEEHEFDLGEETVEWKINTEGDFSDKTNINVKEMETDNVVSLYPSKEEYWLGPIGVIIFRIDMGGNNNADFKMELGK